MNKQTSRIISKGYQKKVQTDEILTEIVESNFESLAAAKEGDIDLVYGKMFQKLKKNIFVEVKLSFDYQSRKLYFDWIEKQQDDSIKASFKWQFTLL